MGFVSLIWNEKDGVIAMVLLVGMKPEFLPPSIGIQGDINVDWVTV